MLSRLLGCNLVLHGSEVMLCQKFSSNKFSSGIVHSVSNSVHQISQAQNKISGHDEQKQ